MQSIGDAAEPAAGADLCPFVDAKHDVDAVAAKPRAFVEAVLRPRRQLHDDERVEDGALRRRAAEVQLELCRLVDRATVERSHAGPARGDRTGLRPEAP